MHVRVRFQGEITINDSDVDSMCDVEHELICALNPSGDESIDDTFKRLDLSYLIIDNYEKENT